jgi:hypothetical protein
MGQSNRGTLVNRFRHPSLVEVRRPKFKRSRVLAYLDVAKLTRAVRAEFEVGHFETGCCRMTVLAVVRKGIVTALRLKGCTDCKPVRLTPELQAALKIARRRIRRGRDRRPFRPVPVSQLVGSALGMIIDGGCEEYCFITILGYRLCVLCCKWNSQRWCGPIIERTLAGAFIR